MRLEVVQVLEWMEEETIMEERQEFISNLKMELDHVKEQYRLREITQTRALEKISAIKRKASQVYMGVLERPRPRLEGM